MKMFEIGKCSLEIREGDITAVDADAIVNAANERMLGGGGVDGAIHRAAGSRLLEACREVKEVRSGVRCPTGEARITPGFDLTARWVIHTVGPVYSGPESAAPLRSAYRESLALANDHGLSSIAFPAISCGVYAYPLDEAASIAIQTAIEHHGSLTHITFSLFGQAAHDAWLKATEALLR